MSVGDGEVVPSDRVFIFLEEFVQIVDGGESNSPRMCNRERQIRAGFFVGRIELEGFAITAFRFSQFFNLT